MARPARSQEVAPGPPPVDPTAVQRAYRLERARRRSRERRQEERRLATLRFLAVVLVLLVLSGFLGLRAWGEIERLFGL